MALIFMAKGGVFLAGGISQKILPALQSGRSSAPPSRTRRRTRRLMHGIPTFVVTHPQAALHAGLPPSQSHRPTSGWQPTGGTGAKGRKAPAYGQRRHDWL